MVASTMQSIDVAQCDACRTSAPRTRASVARAAFVSRVMLLVALIVLAASAARGQEKTRGAVSFELSQPAPSEESIDSGPISIGPMGIVSNTRSTAEFGSACCGPKGHYNRCGCGVFPWHRGPGNCDTWCAGPHWQVSANGVVLFRQNADLDRVISAVVGGTTDPPSLVDQFDHGVGARLLVTGYNDAGFGMQVGYVGVDDMNATLAFPIVAPADPGTRRLNFRSSLHSLQIDFLRVPEYVWQPFAGVRYVELDDDLVDFTDIVTILPVFPNPATTIDTKEIFALKNRLIGFHVGARRDVWELTRRLSLEAIGNAGVYLNDHRQVNIVSTTTTTLVPDDPGTPDDESSTTVTTSRNVVKTEFSEVAFLGEAAVNAVWRINECVALRGGYQILAIDGVGESLDAFFRPTSFARDTLVYHGWQFGFEYRR